MTNRVRISAALTILVAFGLSACAASTTPPERPTLSVEPPAVDVSAAPLTLPEVPSASAYPDALRAAGVPVSVSGRSEELIGSGICGQVRAGRSDAAIAADLETVWSAAQAATAVQLAHAVLHC